MWDVNNHSHIGEDVYAFHTVGICDRFYEFFASHITRPPSKYDVRLNNTASELGPLLFLCHINDLPLSVDSKIRLFADERPTGKLTLLKIKYNFKKTLTHCKTGPKTGACASKHNSATFYPLL